MVLGSPPRGWGRRLHHPRVRYCPRFTPTRVGTTNTGPPGQQERAVHPHAGGDDGEGVCAWPINLGSPPRGWGRRRGSAARAGTPAVHPHAGGDDIPRDDLGMVSTRFTPTRVGTTCLDKVRPRRPLGSPPRGWGRRRYHAGHREWLRFTPTRVGTTQRPSRPRVTLSVHPHAGGDDSR